MTALIVVCVCLLVEAACFAWLAYRVECAHGTERAGWTTERLLLLERMMLLADRPTPSMMLPELEREREGEDTFVDAEQTLMWSNE